MMPFIQLSAAPTLSLCASRQVYAKIDDALKKCPIFNGNLKHFLPPGYF